MKNEVTFSNTVISNTEGKLRNDYNPSNCFCRKVKEPKWNPFVILFFVCLNSTSLIAFILIVRTCSNQNRQQNV